MVPEIIDPLGSNIVMNPSIYMASNVMKFETSVRG
jgi:hypothetical protein